MISNCSWLFSYKERQFVNLARHSWGIVGVLLGYKIENSRAKPGHSWVTVGAQLEQKVMVNVVNMGQSWGRVEAELGHSLGTLSKK